MSKAVIVAIGTALIKQIRRGLAAAILLVCALPARADLTIPASPAGEGKKPSSVSSRPPVQARPLRVEVRRGGSVEILLSGVGATIEQLRFRIRSEPEAGALSELEAVKGGIARVIYTHSGDARAATDRFTYAVQSSRGVSAPAEVAISVLDDPPRLVVPESVSFESVILGERATREIAVENAGGGIAQGKIETAAPFSVEPVEYHLGPGEKAALSVSFAPAGQAVFTRTLRFTGEVGKVTVLRGAGAAPFSAGPDELELPRDPERLTRSGSLAITNNSPAPLEVTISGDERIGMAGADGARAAWPAKVSLPAAPDARTISLVVPASDLAALRATVTVAAGDYSQAVEVFAPAVGAILRASQPRIDFGRVVEGKKAERTLAVQNLGGSPDAVRVSAREPFIVRAEDRSFRLEPGGAREIGVAISANPAPGAHRAPLVIEGGGSRIEVALAAEFPQAAAPPPAGAGPPPGAKPMPATRQPKAAGGSSKIPVAGTLRVTETSSTGATVVWETTEASAADHRLYLRYPIRPRDGVFTVGWFAIPNVTVERGPSAVTFRARKLKPSSGYLVRAMAFDGQENAGQVSPPVEIITRERSRWLRVTPARVLGVLVVVLAILIAIQRRRAAGSAA